MESCLKKLVLEAGAAGFQDPEKGGWEPVRPSGRIDCAQRARLGANRVYTCDRREAKRTIPVYRVEGKPDLSETPVPRFDLLKTDAYASMPIQFSRGCPFQCEFCDIIVLYGRRPRTKRPQQILAELDALLRLGWKKQVFIVDDNFIGNKRKLKSEKYRKKERL